MPTATDHIVALLLAERDRLNRAIEVIQGPVKRRGRPPGSAAEELSVAVPKKRHVSAASRRRMALAQKKRWAAIKGQSPALSQAGSKPQKRRISAEGMKRIIAATKKRWALKRAAEAKLNRAAAKKALKAA